MNTEKHQQISQEVLMCAVQQRHQSTNQKLMERLAELLGGTEQALIWLKSPHPILDNRTPESYVEEGKLEVLEYFIHAIETGQPS